MTDDYTILQHKRGHLSKITADNDILKINLRDWPSEFEDLAFPSRSSREPDEVGSEDMCEQKMKSRAMTTVAEGHLDVFMN
jgi:hypothetical protein